MKNIFKVFKENKALLEENKILKAQNEALTEFRKSFDKYYNDVSSVPVITKTYDKNVVLTGVFSLDECNIDYPMDLCKQEIVRKMSEKLLPFIEFDIVDNKSYGTKDIRGKVIVLTK